MAQALKRSLEYVRTAPLRSENTGLGFKQRYDGVSEAVGGLLKRELSRAAAPSGSPRAASGI